MSVWELTGPLHFYNRNEGVVVCYHAPSGDTHLISAAAHSLLNRLAEDEPADEHELDSPAWADPGSTTLLAELAAAGLVRRL
ncbi:hypothetical protein [Parahaliea aestuarii]|uniref:HPr-rel-A system PqqD family peptide chaperone n=1 Tax=Parahaliea aestuarii TaxID=1852021 RepID=A0A5C8ZQQ7_9GAMM|nr:hypothetical protein [Parahaliea aestuarii]TXS89661.1 hypothetical protein FVW59_16740 [Parahaliea aestuarii]